MKKLIYWLFLVLLAFIIGPVDLLCQTTVNFDYDDNGIYIRDKNYNNDIREF